MVMTDCSITDDWVIEDLLEPMDDILNVAADGAYDTRECYASVLYRDGFPVIIPRKNAALEKKPGSPEALFRNTVIKQIECYGGGEQGRKRYKKVANYHKRSLAETAMFRIKNTFGGHLASRSIDNQHAEAALRCKLLNQFTNRGMPKSEKVV